MGLQPSRAKERLEMSDVQNALQAYVTAPEDAQLIIVTSEAEDEVLQALLAYVAAADNAHLAYLANDGSYPEAQAEMDKAERSYKAALQQHPY